MSTQFGKYLPMNSDEYLGTTADERHLPLQAVGDMLGVGRWTLYKRLKTGELRGRKVGVQYRIHVSEVRRILGTQVHYALE